MTSAKVEVQNLNFSYLASGQNRKNDQARDKKALNNINLTVFENKVTALIGPSGCGKTTLLRCFNRMHDLYPGMSYTGKIILHPSELDILSKKSDPLEIRTKVGMVFQKPNPFPQSIYENIAFGLKIRGFKNKTFLDDKIEDALKKAAIWDEVSDQLHSSSFSLSGGQQQRICIARALAVDPELLLLDEPTSALDPISTARIEELLGELKKTVTILMVTHNLHQAARAADYTAFMYMGDLVEFGESSKIFTNPENEKTENYITGRFG